MPGSIVIKVKGGQRNHNFGLAIDVFPIWSRWQDPHEKGR